MLGNRIAEIRKELNMTQKELASRLNVTPSAISNYENSYSLPSVEFLCQISECLNVSCDYLLGLTQNRRPIDELRSHAYRGAGDDPLVRMFLALSLAPKAKRSTILKVMSALLAELD